MVVFSASLGFFAADVLEVPHRYNAPAIFAAIFAKIAFVTANGSALWLVWLAFGLSRVGCGEESQPDDLFFAKVAYEPASYKFEEDSTIHTADHCHRFDKSVQ